MKAFVDDNFLFTKVMAVVVKYFIIDNIITIKQFINVLLKITNTNYTELIIIVVVAIDTFKFIKIIVKFIIVKFTKIIVK